MVRKDQSNSSNWSHLKILEDKCSHAARTLLLQSLAWQKPIPQPLALGLSAPSSSFSIVDLEIMLYGPGKVLKSIILLAATAPIRTESSQVTVKVGVNYRMKTAPRLLLCLCHVWYPLLGGGSSCLKLAVLCEL